MQGSAQPRLDTKRSAEWDKLRRLVQRTDSQGLGSLTEEELWELPSLYRRTLSDLSLLRSQGAQPHLVQDLSQLCNRAHSLIYRGVVNRRQGPGPVEFIVHELPRTVRRRRWFIFAAAFTLVLFGVIAWFNCAMDRTIAEDTLNAFAPDMLREWQTGLQAASEQGDLRLAAQIDVERRGFSAFYITVNNIKVGFFSFIMGIFGGLPTLIMMAFNGYLLGAIAFLYFTTPPGFDVNLPLYFLAGVIPHGSIELPAITIAGAAGMLLGFSWLFPGQRPRGESLRLAVRDAGRLVAACTVTLVFAGLIEGFITPLNPPQAVPLELWFKLKITFGVLVFALWLTWLLAGGRQQQAAAYHEAGRG